MISENNNPFMKSTIESQLEFGKKSGSDISSEKTRDATSKESVVFGDNKPTRTIEKTLTIKEEGYQIESQSNIKIYLIIAFVVMCIFAIGIFWYRTSSNTSRNINTKTI